jgi:hypothetical protein
LVFNFKVWIFAGLTLPGAFCLWLNPVLVVALVGYGWSNPLGF